MVATRRLSIILKGIVGLFLGREKESPVLRTVWKDDAGFLWVMDGRSVLCE